jgi:hypothetical protein
VSRRDWGVRGGRAASLHGGRSRKPARRAEPQTCTGGGAARRGKESGELASTHDRSDRMKGEARAMPGKELVDKLSIYIPQKRLEEKPVERLMKLGKRRDRSVNYLVVEAILEYLNREDNKN